ncbi:MAG: Ig-like domain-containing protein [Lachnospiraceae bacterium]|nr:Ig-like domain-containing protein [Lachnospiraceae bacterium]
MKKLFKRIIAITLSVAILFSFVPNSLTFDKAAAVTKFYFDGTNADAYAYETYVVFDMVNIDGTNAQIASLVEKIKSVKQEITFEFSSKVRVIGKGVTAENGTYTGVFEDIYNLSVVNFAKATSLTVIESQAFRNCTSLAQSVYISGTKYVYTTIDTIAGASNNIQAGTLWLPANLTYMGEAAFANTLFYKYDISSKNDSYEAVNGVLFNDSQNVIMAYPPARYEAYVVPDTVSSIYQYAFEECIINKITIPATVSSIGKKAFYNSLLTAVIFNQDAACSIGSGAFYQDAKDDRFIGLNKWAGISQITISEASYDKSTNFINNQDETACFTPYLDISASGQKFATGCDIYVEPKITVSGVPLVWSSSANLNFYWTSNSYYSVDSLYLEKYGEVTFDSGSYASNAISVKDSGSYDLTVGYTNKNGNSQTKTITIDITTIDSVKPADVTYTLIDDVCYLHSYDTESGLDQIKYELNNNDVRTYTSEGFTLASGYNTVICWATDNVGNQTEKITYTIRVGNESRSVKLNVNSKQLEKGNTFKLTTTFTPSTTVNQDVTYSSSDLSIATVDEDGTVKGVNVGYAVIKVTSVNGMTDKCAVVVTGDPFVLSEVELYKSNTYKLYIKNLRDDYDYYFKSDNKSIATVTKYKGKITAKGIGECTITAVVDTGVRVYKLPCTVVVYKPKVKITTKPSYIKVGQKYKFKAYKKGLSKNIQWTSSNKTVATINKSSGRAIGRKKGTTTITAKIGSYKSTYKLTVK